MLLTVVDVSPVKQGVGKQSGKSYDFIELEYEANGTTKTKLVNQYSDYFDLFKAALPDQQFSVTVKKNGKYYDWTHVEAAVGGTQSGNGAEHTQVAAQTEAKRIQKTGYQARPANTYETAEERAARQELIVMQSSITAALKFYELNSKAPNFEEIKALTHAFRDLVFGVPQTYTQTATPRVE